MISLNFNFRNNGISLKIAPKKKCWKTHRNILVSCKFHKIHHIKKNTADKHMSGLLLEYGIANTATYPIFFQILMQSAFDPLCPNKTFFTRPAVTLW